MASNTEMDEGAMSASMELEEMERDGTVSTEVLAALADWWKRWYMQAGHKRLGRVLMAKHAESEVKEDVPANVG